MSETAHVRYVFLDIVGFTRNRTVEAQSDIVAVLNDVVENAKVATVGEIDETIYLPTGDGMAIAILDSKSWEVHLRLGLYILRNVAERNLRRQTK